MGTKLSSASPRLVRSLQHIGRGRENERKDTDEGWRERRIEGASETETEEREGESMSWIDKCERERKSSICFFNCNAEMKKIVLFWSKSYRVTLRK